MSVEEQSNYSDIDYLLEKKEEELRELGAMRLRAIERANEELKEQVDQYSAILKSKDEEIDRISHQYMHSSFHKNDYDRKIQKLTERLQEKDIDISELKTSVNTYYNDLMKEKKKTQDYKQEVVSFISNCGLAPAQGC